MTHARSKACLMSRLALLACAAGLVGGCGWTARDEFFRNRSLVLAPQAGDGSQITSTTTLPATPLVGMPQVAEAHAQASDRSTQ